MLKNEMKVKDLMEHIDSCFKIYIARKDKTKIGYYSDKWEIPSDIAEMEIFNWACCETRVLITVN